MSQLMEQIFTGEIREGVTIEQGLADLRKLYPPDLEYNMKDDDDFKAGRKTRAECNKTVEKFNRRRIDLNTEVKKFADGVICDIKEIYDPLITAFEKEDNRRKKLAAEEALKHQVLIDGQLAEIKNIYGFCDTGRDNKTSIEIQGLIEAVDLIETDQFHKDVIHEAIEAKKSTLLDLSQLLSDTTAKENVEKERNKLRIEQELADEKSRQAEVEQAITERINNLRMIPTNFLGKSSEKINAKITALSRFEITEADFSNRVSEVSTALDLVVSQLTMAFDSAKRDEYVKDFEAKEAAKKLEEESPHPMKSAIDSKQKEIAQDTQGIDPEEDMESKAVIDDIPIEQSPENQTNEEWIGNYSQAEPPIKSAQEDINVDIKGFLEWCVNDESVLNDFGYLLVSSDSKLEDEALDVIKAKYCNYMNG